VTLFLLNHAPAVSVGFWKGFKHWGYANNAVRSELVEGGRAEVHTDGDDHLVERMVEEI
jgi:hypothetical protein